MARPRNEEAEADIRAAAFAQLLSSGYAKVSYQKVSDATGYSRAFVQHYFPKKESFLTGLLESLLHECDACVADLRDVANINVSMLLSGQLYFSFLADARHRVLALDMLESRRLTELAIDFNERYEADRTNATSAQRTAALDGLVRIIGGSYELLFHKLNAGLPFDPLTESLYIVQGYMRLADISDDSFDAVRAAATLSKKEVTYSIETIRKNLLDSPATGASKMN